MPSIRFGLRRWFTREIDQPLTAMYARIDDHLLPEDEPAEPRPTPEATRSPASE